MGNIEIMVMSDSHLRETRLAKNGEEASFCSSWLLSPSLNRTTRDWHRRNDWATLSRWPHERRGLINQARRGSDESDPYGTRVAVYESPVV